MVSMNSFEFLPLESSSQQENNLNSVEFEVISEVEADPNGELYSVQTDESSDSFSLDCTASEISSRIKKLLDENSDLKEKLSNRKKVMNEQLETIAAWNDQLTNSTNKHRAMIDDLMKKNQKLEEEKESLKKSLEDAEEKINMLSETSLELNALKRKCLDLEEQLYLYKSKEQRPMENCSITSIVTDNDSDYAIVVKEDFISVKTDDDELKNILQENKCLKSKIESLFQELDIKKHKVEELTKTLENKDLQDNGEKQNQSINSLCIVSMNEGAQVQSTSIQELQAQINTLTSRLQEEKDKVEESNHLLNSKIQEMEELQFKYDDLNAEVSEHVSHISYLREKQKQLLSENNELRVFKEKYENLDAEATNFKKKWEDLQLQICEKDHTIEKFKKDLDHANEIIKEQQLQNELNRKSILASEQNFILLSQEHADLLTLMKGHDIPANNSPRSSLVASERAELQNKVDSVMAQLLQTEDAFQNEQNKVIQLTREVKVLTEDCECIPVLKAQVEVYKSDLEATKAANCVMEEKERALMHEINALKEEVKSLQEHIQNQSDGRRGNRHMRNGHGYQQRENSNPTEPQMFTCPCCPLLFQNYKALENHVEMCLLQT